VRILIYGINFAPEITGCGKYTGELAEQLMKRGHEVSVVTAPPYYPAWVVPQAWRGKAWSRDVDCRVWRCPIWVPQAPSGLKRIIHLMSFALSSFPIMLARLRDKPDVIWCVQPTFFTAPTTLLVAKLSGAKSWLHIQDYEIDAAYDLGLIKGRYLRRFVRFTESAIMRAFDRVSSISGKMMERALFKGVDPSRLLALPNWVDAYEIRPQKSSYREKLGIAADVKVALYSGNMGTKQGLEILVELARRLREYSHLTFVYCGNGPGKDELEDRCAGLSNVQFLDLQPKEQLSDLLALADIHLLPQRADAADLVMPSKLTGMMASGKPVVVTAANDTELQQVVALRAECGLVVAPGDPQAFADAVLFLANSDDLRDRLGSNGRRYAETELHCDEIIGRFEQQLLQLVGSGR